MYSHPCKGYSNLDVGFSLKVNRVRLGQSHLKVKHSFVIFVIKNDTDDEICSSTRIQSMKKYVPVVEIVTLPNI